MVKTSIDKEIIDNINKFAEEIKKCIMLMQ